MKTPQRTAPLPEKIDKLTRSIENALTSESFPTQVRPLLPAQARQLMPHEWQFNWVKECTASDREVLQLTTVANPHIIHGLLSLEIMPDLVFMHLVESASFNKGRTKAYVGVLGNLTAYACRRSFELGLDGYVAFDSKTSLVSHYKAVLEAVVLTGTRLYLGTAAARKLVNRYYPDPSAPY